MIIGSPSSFRAGRPVNWVEKSRARLGRLS
ncbi:hypothetical protein LINGRAHAP2_LOCUS29951 [Linum grandiflorum]